MKKRNIRLGVVILLCIANSTTAFASSYFNEKEVISQFFNIQKTKNHYFNEKEVISQSFHIDIAVDEEPPTLFLAGNPTEWTNQDVLIKVIGTEEENGSGIKAITLPDNEVIKPKEEEKYLLETEFLISENGDHIFTIEDNSKNVYSETLVVTKIDKEEPSTPQLTQVDQTLVLTKSTDNLSGIAKHLYQLDNKDWVAFDSDIDMATLDEFDVIKVKSIDNAGNESDVSEITPEEDNSLKDATDAVEKAEDSKKQEDVDDARDLVNKLPDGPDKDDLNDRLDNIQKEIDEEIEKDNLLKDATDAVEKAEDSKKQDDVDNARDKVNKLPDGKDKDDLNDRLDAIQKEIEDNKDVTAPTIDITGISGNWVNDDIIVDLFVKEEAKGSGIKEVSLPNGKKVTFDADDKQMELALNYTIIENDEYMFKAKDNEGNLREKMVTVTNIDKEEPTMPTFIFEDNNLNLIPAEDDLSGVDKHLYRMSNDSSKLETMAWLELDGEIDLSNLETGEYVTQVKATDNAGNESEVFELSFDVINENDALKDATDAVEKAEDSKKQEDVDNARDLVNKLPDGQDKTDLNDRLDAIQKEIDDKKELDDKIKDLEDKIDNATDGSELDEIQKEIDNLPDGPEKDEIQDALDDKRDELDKKEELDNLLKEATKAVEKAEDTITQEDVDSARDLVNKLPDSKEKLDLSKRLDDVQAKIDYKKQLEEATKAVEKAEDTLNRGDINNAYNKVNKLPNGPDKTDLLDRLEALEKQIADDLAKEKEDKEALRAVVLAENLKRNPYIQNAKDKVAKLPSGSLKTELEERLLNLEKLLNGDSPEKIKNVERYVSMAETLKRNPHIDNAIKLVNELQAGPEKEAFLLRIERLNNSKMTLQEIETKRALIEATSLVEQAEQYNYETTKDKAAKSVNKLGNVKEKALLNERLNKIVIE